MIAASPDRIKRLRHAAADLVERVGWTQNEAQLTENGAICPWWAIYSVEEIDGQLPSATECLAAICQIEAELGLDHPGLVDWNDVEGRTQEEVIAALRGKAA